MLTFSGLKNREERERQYFDTGLPATSSALMNEDVVEDDELYDRVSHVLLFPRGRQMFDMLQRLELYIPKTKGFAQHCFLSLKR